jgi:VanZ family protein
LYRFLERNKVALIYWPLGIYWAVLLVLTSLPGKDLPDFKVSDKFEHFLAFCGLAMFLYLSLFVQEKYQKLKNYSSSFTLLIVGIYAALDELHQLFIPGRDCEFLDWIADFTGAFAAVLIIRMILKYFLSKQFKWDKFENK